MRYPIGVQTFEKMINGGYVYVDKTDLIYDLVQENVCFLSRPRRFGKSLLLSTLEAYFLGQKELFKGLKIDGLEKDWLEYPIFRIDFSNGDYSNPDELSCKLNAYLSSWEQLYGKKDIFTTYGDRFQYVLEQAYKKTGRKAVVLIDEYDKPMLDVLGEEQEKINRNILRGFYGTFKAADASLRFVMLAGVTKFSQITVFSGFNQPKDISMSSHYDALCGITEEELYETLAEPIREMAHVMDFTVEEMKAALKKHYDGYHFSKRMLDIYNPFSIINALDEKSMDDYWYRSGTPTYLAKLIEGHNINMQELLEQPYEPKYFMDYKADVEDPLAMLYQSGYLTIKEYDAEYNEYLLDYPNDEVRSGFVILIANGYFEKTSKRPESWVKRIGKMLDTADLDSVRDAYTSFLASIPYEADKDVRALNFETHFQYTFYIINRLLSCHTVLIEKQNSCGRVDIVVETKDYIYIFEFKVDKSADEALEQIEEKQYALPYLDDPRKLYKVGVSISSETRTVAQWMVVDEAGRQV